jgi:acetyltransferase-like isoleucine patch superfamily enzyme
MSSILSEFRLYLCNHIIANIPSHTIRLWYYRKIMGFKIGKRSSIFMGCKFDCAKGFILAENAVINGNCRIDPRGGVEIGSNVIISSDVQLITMDHDTDIMGKEKLLKKILVEDYAWISTRALILPGITIGKGAVVAAGAVVTRNVDPFTVVAGIPAKFLREKEPQTNYTVNYRRKFQ